MDDHKIKLGRSVIYFCFFHREEEDNAWESFSIIREISKSILNNFQVIDRESCQMKRLGTPNRNLINRIFTIDTIITRLGFQKLIDEVVDLLYKHIDSGRIDSIIEFKTQDAYVPSITDRIEVSREHGIIYPKSDRDLIILYSNTDLRQL